MSTLTPPLADRTDRSPWASPLWRRTLAVARMHTVDLRTLLAIPLGVLASVIVINLLIWQVVSASGRQTGGAASLYVFLTIVGLLSVASGLPFAFGMGASRRAFLAGTLLTGLGLSTVFGLIYLVLQVAEHASDGWWQQGEFFWFPWFARSPEIVDLLFFVVSMFACFTVGILGATCWMRWNRLALLVGGPGTVLVVGGAVVLVTWRGWWHYLGHWFAAQTPLTATGWSALLVVVLAALSHLVLRRARG
jgi:hypothetical protein